MSSLRLLSRVFIAGLVCSVGSHALWSAEAPKDAATLRPLLETFVKEFVAITPGQGKFPATFQFGAPRATREVRLAESFAMAKYEVPQNLYEAVMGEEPSRWKGPRNSVEMMSAADAEAFCRKITEALRAAGLLKESEEIRLPTEEEWEYCCRAGTETRYSFGDKAQGPDDKSPKASLLDKYGWHHGNAAGNDPPVGASRRIRGGSTTCTVTSGNSPPGDRRTKSSSGAGRGRMTFRSWRVPRAESFRLTPATTPSASAA